MRLRIVPIITAATAAALALSACAPQAPSTSASSPTSTGSETSTDTDTPTDSPGGLTPSPDAVLNIATTTDVNNFNPLLGNSRSDSWVTNLMYPHLLGIDETGAKVANLATDWGYIDDTHGYFEIRTDMTWSDGTPITAEDVAFTLNATKRDEPPGTFFGQMYNFESAEAVSDSRVELVFTQPDSSILEELGFWGVVIPKHVFEPAGNVADFANKGPEWVSAGPYVMTGFQAGQSYTMERVDNYPLVEGGTPWAARVVFRVYPDLNTEILALQSGEVQMIANAIPPAQVATLESDPNVDLAEVPGLGYAHIVYNMKHEDLAKTEVRQALARLIDYEAIRQVVLQGQAVSNGSSPLMQVLAKYYDSSLTEYPHDPQAARDLLTAAGYEADANGKFNLNFRILYSLQDVVTSQWVTMVKDWAAEVGINITLDGYERNTYLQMTNAGDYDIYAGSFAIMDDPVTNFALSYLPDGVINYTYVDDPELNALIEKAMLTFEEDEKIAIMQEAAKIVHDEVYDNIMYTQTLYFAHSAKWTGFIPAPSELLSIVNPLSVASAHITE